MQILGYVCMDKDMMVREYLSIGDFDYEDTKHVLLCGDVGYIKYCGLTMTSIFMSNPKHHFEIHLVCDDVNETDYRKLEETSSKFASKINVYKLNHSVVQSLVGNVNKNFHISVAAFFRILGFSILGKYIDKVLYLDSDIMVTGDIGRFFGGGQQFLYKCNSC